MNKILSRIIQDPEQDPTGSSQVSCRINNREMSYLVGFCTYVAFMTKLDYFLNNIGIGGVLVFIATEYNKMKYGKNKPPELEYKLKMAKVQLLHLFISLLCTTAVNLLEC